MKDRAVRELISIAWFICALVGCIVCELTYGFWSRPISHVASTVVYLALGAWLYYGTKMLSREPERR